MLVRDLIGVTEMSQQVSVYKVGEDGWCYSGMSAHVPEEFMGLRVECVQAYEWEIDILVSEQGE